MSPSEINVITGEAMWILIKLSFPIMFAGMISGLLISFIQAITQIHENSLSFIPKMLAIFLSIIFMMPFISKSLFSLTARIFDAISHV